MDFFVDDEYNGATSVVPEQPPTDELYDGGYGDYGEEDAMQASPKKEEFSYGANFESEMSNVNDNVKGPYDMSADDERIFSSHPADGPLLPEPNQMREEAAAFREWRRQNAIYLEEREKMEKEMRSQIMNEAEEYKKAFDEKNTKNVESQKNLNREREKLYYKNQDKFHKEADQQYWKAIAEIVPREVAKIDKRRGKKEEEKNKTSIVVIQGPKPGKPTDLSRMRQLLLKLKQNPPPHMIPKPPEKDGKDEKDGKNEKDVKDSKDEKDGKDEKDAKNGKVPSPKKAKGKDKKDNQNDKTATSPGAKNKPVSPAKGVAS